MRFCPSCGAAVAPPEPSEEQRKIVSVLFADLVGFTSTSEQADPEDMREILASYFADTKAVIERYGGVVEKFIGDAVMAVFGAPVSRGDDAERAVRAALEIPAVIAALDARTPGFDLQVRAAVNTGETMVAIGPSGNDEVLVVGDVVNTASRLQSAAPPGRVVVGDATYRATVRAIGYEPIEPISAKGKREPVPAWLAVEPIAPLSGFASTSPLVGRSDEMSLLVDVWERAVGHRNVHLVTVLGEPGIGKSRLAFELSERVKASGGRAWDVRELPYTQSSGYEGFGQLVKDVSGTHSSDVEARSKLDRSLTDLGIVDPDLLQLLSTFVGETENPAVGRSAMFDAARRWIEALARQQPTLLVLEDIHWAHASALDLIESIASRARDAPMMLLALARPELLDVRPGWGGGLTASTTFRLDPLSPEQAHVLAARWMGEADETLIGRVETVAAGNPLFIEEMAVWSREVATDTSELPTTVKAMIAARLDALPSEERHVLYDASVVGKEFWLGSLQRSDTDVERLGSILESLQDRDLIREEQHSSIHGDREYTFRHILIRDVAYATLTKAARRDRHEAVARFIEGSAFDSDKVDAILAYHWKEGGDTERAVSYLLSAAEQAGSGWAYVEAMELYEQALNLIPRDDERRREIGIKRGVAGVRYEHAVGEERQLRRAASDPSARS